jgi:hypothetical protein
MYNRLLFGNWFMDMTDAVSTAETGVKWKFGPPSVCACARHAGRSGTIKIKWAQFWPLCLFENVVSPGVVCWRTPSRCHSPQCCIKDDCEELQQTIIAINQ